MKFAVGAAAVSVAFVFVGSATSAMAQVPTERAPQPRAIEPWQPSSSSTTTSEAETSAWPTAPTKPVGFATGPFKLYPSVTAGAFHDDNVFASNSNKRSDWAYFVRPELGLTAVGQGFQLAAAAFIEARRYDTYTSEDQVSGAAEVASTLMPDPDTQIKTRVKYAHAYEARGSGEDLLNQYDKPVQYDQLDVAGAFNRRFGRFWTSLGAANTWIRYDTPTIAGATVDQSYRDGNIGVVSGRAGYVIAPLTSLFAEVSTNRRDFEVDIYDSTGYRVVGGVLLEDGPGARVRGEAYAGYMNQNYSGATFATVSTWTYGAALAWLIAPNLSATFEGKRDAAESALNGGVSVIETLAGARLDYRLLTNLVVGAGATYLVDEFLDASRTDRTLSPLVSARYFVNPFITLGFDYRYITLNSDGLGVLGYTRNVFLFSVNGRI